MKKVLVASVMVAFVLTGCNTFKGFGQDVSKAGDAVTNTAQKLKIKCKLCLTFKNLIVSIRFLFLNTHPLEIRLLYRTIFHLISTQFPV